MWRIDVVVNISKLNWWHDKVLRCCDWSWERAMRSIKIRSRDLIEHNNNLSRKNVKKEWREKMRGASMHSENPVVTQDFRRLMTTTKFNQFYFCSITTTIRHITIKHTVLVINDLDNNLTNVSYIIMIMWVSKFLHIQVCKFN